MSASEFKIIRPIEITDSMLSSSSVQEALTSEWAGGTTYAINAIVGVTTGHTQLVYKSLQNGNIGNTPATSPTWWRYQSTVYAPYSVGTTYTQGDIVSNISTNTHELYESLVAGNVGNALTNTAKWQALGATPVVTGDPRNSTNRWSMFDKSWSTQTENAEEITVTLLPGQTINSLALLNLDAASVRIQQSVSGFDRTISLNRHPVLNWYDFWYEPLIRETDIAITDIPPYPASTLTITISNPGGIAKCGLCIVGQSKTMGVTQWDADRSIIDYSSSAEDVYGNVVLVRRAYSKRMNFEFLVKPGLESTITRTLESYRAIPIVAIGSDAYGNLILFGFLGAWSIPVSQSGKMSNMEIKGLV